MPTIPLDLERGLDGLYERDEVAWYDAMATLIGQGRTEELDFSNLKEILGDMGKRDRREVWIRLRDLMFNWLKWEYQPDQRTGGWVSTLRNQRSELVDAASDSRTLHNHLVEVYAKAYKQAVRLAEAETGLPPETFPATCPVRLDELLAE